MLVCGACQPSRCSPQAVVDWVQTYLVDCGHEQMELEHLHKMMAAAQSCDLHVPSISYMMALCTCMSQSQVGARVQAAAWPA